MSASLALAFRGLLRRPARTVTQILVLGLAVALLGAMILFIGHTLRTMTGSAIRSVPVDLQGPVGSYAKDVKLASRIGRQPEIRAATPTATAPFAGITHHGPAGTTSAGEGSVFAAPAGYPSKFKTLRFLRGQMRPGQIVLDQQLASTLQAQIGDRVSMRAGHGNRHVYRVSGIALVSSADVLFQPLNPLLGPAPAQPPANVAIMSLATFQQTLAPDLPTIPPGTAGSAAVPGAQKGVQWQIQAQVDPGALGDTPGKAYTRAGQIRNKLEATFTGQVQFVDNLSDSLNTAAGDALYADALYIMLAVPGAILALGLAYLAALGSVEEDRRELALLRARGASRRKLVGLALAESALIGIVAGLLGAGIAFAADSVLVKGSIGLNLTRALLTIGACVVLAWAGAAAARLSTVLRAARASVREGRQSVVRESRPLWQRLYLDLLSLALSGLIYWLTASTGFSAVINPDSNPTLSLSVYMFFAPALLWIGTTLLLVRLRGRIMAFLIGRLQPRQAGRGRDFLLASAGRRAAAINRGLVLVGLLLAFGVSLGVFTATYDQQANVDAQLTLGADVTATGPPGALARHRLEARIAKLPGVSGTTPVDHSYAYVGPDLQDTYGINPATIGKATTLRDSYFVGASAKDTLQRLRSTHDGILVSKETITDYSLNTGDLLRLRVLDSSTGKFLQVPFHVVGTVQEFPSAPRDSFMVANLSYLRAADNGGPNTLFIKTSGDPTTVARTVAGATSADGLQVNNIDQQAAQTVSSITTVDLSGISKIEEAFTVLLAAAAMWLFVSLVVAERRGEFATMAALGASLRDIGAFVRSEAVLVLGGAAVLAVFLGWLLSMMLVALLRHVFDPPPDHLAIPWMFLTELGGAALLGGLVAALLASRGLRRLPLGSILREQ